MRDSNYRLQEYKKKICAELEKEPHGKIKLNKFEMKILNLFSFFDYFMSAKNLRRFYIKKPSPFEKYFQRFKAKTEQERAIVIEAAKLNLTQKMIYCRKTPEKFKVYSRKSLCTPCGWIRLGIAILHKNDKNKK